MSELPAESSTELELQPRCPRCNKPFTHQGPSNRQVTCPACHSKFQIHVFSPRIATSSTVPVAAAGPDGATPCGYHPGNVATTNCQHCGTFICGLCEVTLEGRRLCVSCFDRLRSENKLETTISEFRDYGSIAASSAVFGCLIPYFSIILGPLAVYYSIKAFRQKKAMNETDGRLAIALSMILGLVGTGVVLFLIGAIVVGLING